MKEKSTYRKLCIGFLFMAAAFSCFEVTAQVSPSSLDYPHNHLPWFTIESNHFMVHYQEGNSRTAQVVSGIAEEIYEPVTSFYSHKPRKKVSIVLRDREDFSNGAAFFFDDKIEIWLPALDTHLRGSHPWLQNVITHEFTHIVQLGASMQRTQRIPAIYFQWLNYEDVRRPDVLYGFPKGIVTLPFSTVSIPAWFAEGTAQYQVSGHAYDYWDSHRDMLLRTRILAGTPLDLTGMGTFTSKTSLERELAYNQGYDFTIYLVSRFGQSVIADITKASAKTGKRNFNHAIKHATGVDAKELFSDWIAEKNEYYSAMTESINKDEVITLEHAGFLNFYPQYNTDGSVFAYLTNRYLDSGVTSLLIVKDGEEITVDDLGNPQLLDAEQSYNTTHGFESNPSIEFVSNRFSFSPDGSNIAYSRADKNRYGETYQDIYLYNIANEERKQITKSARIQDPAWHPSLEKIVAIRFSGGTQNIVTINLTGGDIQQLTDFRHGETVYTPVWSADGEKIYFAMASTGNRNIAEFDMQTGDITAIFQDDLIDFRDPWPDPHHPYLYFSSDASGIFNIYRKNLETARIEKITDRIGGAFMPFVRDEMLYIADYRHDGYKISSLPIQENPEPRTGQFREMLASQTNQLLTAGPGTPYYGIEPLPFHEEPKSNEEQIFTSESDPQERSWRPYSETTTGLSIFPVVRFDNYTKREGSNSRLLRNAHIGDLGKNLWRDFKAGAYFSSRDVTERFSIFGGALLGWGSLGADGPFDFVKPSRLNNLDRDLFMIVEYRGIPFIRSSWSPTISVEFYNQTRNVRNGITIEEFPCTSCLPVERGIDIRYNLWEANLFLRSKLNRWSYLELGAAYSPYSVSTEGFFSEEFQEPVSGSTSQYFRGSTYTASYVFDGTLPAVHSDIAPVGLKGFLSYRFEPGRLLQDFEINDGILSPVFSRDNNHSVEARARMGMPITRRTTGILTARSYTYFTTPEDYFYQDYAGGLSGLRSYPYFAVGGQRTLFARASLLRPVFEQINHQAGAYTFDKIFAHLFFETGNGWGGPLNIGNNLKSGVGAELRFSFNSSYLFPMKFFVNTTYGFNRFNVTLPSQFISTSGTDSIRYGREVLFYFGLTFDFDLL